MPKISLNTTKSFALQHKIVVAMEIKVAEEITQKCSLFVMSIATANISRKFKIF